MPPAGLQALVVRPLLPKVQRTIMLVHRRNRAPSPLAQRVWSLIREMAAQRRER
jgi:DNA-binding transcriptional LysR family regulator